MEEAATPTLDELLAHASWARALARELVLDEARADDVVQQAWLAACKRPPTPGPGLRVWLAQLIRNVARNQRRADARRAQREELAASPERSIEPPVPEVVSEFEAQQLVAQALLELDEPYRETLLRRWYRDEKPAAIARAMAVPVKTVDTRLARGLERLRGRLTERKGGDARSWVLLLLPIAREAPATAAAAAGGAIASVAAGVTAMTLTAKLVAAGVVAAAAAATWVAVAERRGVARTEDATLEARAAAAPESSASAPAAATSAPVAASRSVEKAAAAEAKGPARDPSARYRGTWHLHGRVVAKGNHAPIVGAEVTARLGLDSLLFMPPLDTVQSDARGEFTLERLSEGIRLAIHAEGFLSLDAKLEAGELLAAADAPPRDFEIEAPTYGALVATLRARDSREIPARILKNAKLFYGPAEITGDFYERFDRLPKPVANGPATDMAVAFARDGDRFVVDHVPATVPVELFARLDRSQIGRLRVEPLAPGETRTVAVAIDCGIVVGVQCVDAATGTQVPMEWANSWLPVTLRWTGARAADHLTREMGARELEGCFTVPGPGRVAFSGSIDGFAPIACEFDVVDGSTLAIPLVRWRQLLVKVVTKDGTPWPRRKNLREQGETPTTHFAGSPFMASGRAPDCLVVADGTEPPARLDPDAPSVANALRAGDGPTRGRLIGDGFELFAPSQPLRVGIYDDGKLVGSADVPATAPTFEDDAPPRSPGTKAGAIVPDPPVKPWANRFGPLQTVTVVVNLTAAADGELRFEAAGGDGAPVANYEVILSPLVDDEPDLLVEAGYRVDDAKQGLFHCTAIPAGEWQMRIRRGRTGVFVWCDAITVEGGRVNDLGRLTLREEGKLDVRVVDEAGVPLADAEVRLVARPSGTPLEFAESGRFRRTVARTDADGHALRLDVAAQPVRVEAASAGYLAGGADVDVTAASPASCTVTLRAAATSPR